MITKKSALVPIIFLVLFTWGCSEKKKEAINRPAPLPVPEKTINLTLIRFEQDLLALPVPVQPTDVRTLRSRYGEFFELWCTQLSGLLPPGEAQPSDAEIALNLRQYLADKYIREVFQECNKQFNDAAWLEKDLERVFTRYKTAFPGKLIPTILTYASPFSSNVMAMDSMAGIGVHFYLGADYKYYPGLGLPGYMIRKLRREYMVKDLLQGWLDSEYLDDSAQVNCLSQMIYYGKTLFAAELLAPELPDTILTGYTAQQLEWAYRQEEQLWGFFIEQNLLYKTNPKIYIKYIHDGNTTGGFPKEAPARLGPFIGWQIVRSYMKNHPGMNLRQLFEIRDAQKILAESGYKPPKTAS